MFEAQRAYDYIADYLKIKFMEQGMKENEAEKKAIENARAVLPNACETKIIVTMNARVLLHFFSKRCCSRAQDEIRDLAWEMLRLVKEVAPNIFRYAGPSCVRGECPEGDMSCKA
jgi:thymidylate synthase (FAD)